MGKKLDGLIQRFSISYERESGGDTEALYSAQKALEKEIVKEIVEEESSRISKLADKKARRAAIDHMFKELRSLVVQCVLLALLVGLLGSHIFELMSSCWYSIGGTIDVQAVVIGSLVCFVACAAIVVWISIARISDFVNSLTSTDEEED